MSDVQRLLVVGGTAGIGLEIVQHYAGRGLVGDLDRTRRRHAPRRWPPRSAATFEGLRSSLSEPETIAGCAGRRRRARPRRDRRHRARRQHRRRTTTSSAATRLVTMKLIGYTEVVHTLLPRLSDDASIVLFGGLARDRPYPGSTTVSTINGGIGGLVHTLAAELGADPGQRAAPGHRRRQPVLVGQGGRDRQRSRPGRRSDATSRWPTSSTASTSCSAIARSTAIELAIDGGWLAA